MAAAIHADHAAIVEHAALGLDVDDAGGAVAIFGGQGAGDQPHGFRQARIERLAEHRNAFRQDDAVQAVLQAVMLAAHMQLAEAVLGHAGRLQDHGIERGIVAARLGLNILGGDGVGRGAGLGLDAVAGRGQLLGGDGDGFGGFRGRWAKADAENSALAAALKSKKGTKHKRLRNGIAHAKAC